MTGSFKTHIKMYNQFQEVTVLNTKSNLKLVGTVQSSDNEKEVRVSFTDNLIYQILVFRTSTGKRRGSSRFIANWAEYKLVK